MEPGIVCEEHFHPEDHSSKEGSAEREILQRLLAQFTAKLEDEVREQLHAHRFLLEEGIAREFEQMRQKAGTVPQTSIRDDPVEVFHEGEDPAPRRSQEEGEVNNGNEADADRMSSSRTDKSAVWWKGSSASIMNLNSSSFINHEGSQNHYSKAFAKKLRKMEKMWGRVVKDKKVDKTKSNVDRKTFTRNGRRIGRASIRFFNPRSFVHGTFFNLLSAALIVANAVFIGYQSHVGIMNEFSGFNGQVEELKWDTPELLFLAFFTAELGLRIAYDRLRFIRGDEWRWNLFDSVIVGVSLLETLAASILSGIGLNFPFLRLVRVVRVLRVLKVLHMIPFFKRLGLMMSSVAASLSALAPAFVLLILVIYMFGICVMQGVINYLETTTLNVKEAWLATLELRFGTMYATMQTLFCSVTSGISWVEVLDGLNELGGVYNIVFMFYVGFVQICVLNIVTGVFVDTVHQMYQPEREEMIEREAGKRKAMLQSLKVLLEEADEDGSGTITWEEFEQFTSDTHIRMYLSAHEIDITQAREIFDLIDCNAAGEVSIDEFVISFMEFKGAAKGADVVILRNLVNKILMKLNPFVQDSRIQMEDLKWLLKTNLRLSSHLLPQLQLFDREDNESVVLPSVGGKGGSGGDNEPVVLPSVGGKGGVSGKGSGAAVSGKGTHVPTFMGRLPQGDTVPM